MILIRAQEIPPAEYAARRRALMERLGDGITLLHARSSPKDMEQWGFVQDGSFFYFSGLANLPEAVLALDAPAHRVTLFVPPAPLSFGSRVEHLVPSPGPASARTLGLDAVEPWDSLVSYLRGRLTRGVRAVYVDQARRPEALGTPQPLWPVAGELTLWRRSLAQAFPQARVGSAQAAIQALRFVKSPGEVALLRDNARITARALLAGLKRIGPGIRQRDAEAAVVSACIAAGAEGPSFWPWTMAGPNAHLGALVRAFYDYRQLDRAMQAGELVRVDIGCAAHGYGADVGRTVPVSGRFSEGQREVWELLIAAYRAGMARIRAGVAIAAVLAVSREEIARRAPSLRTDQGKRAAAGLLAKDGMAAWSIHGVGVESGETPLPVLAAGAVIAFEPIFSAGDDAFYLEDMILVTKDGSEVLSAGLPYAAAEIEAAMRR